MSDYSEYFLNSLSSVVQLELLEISHPNFSKVYRVVRNAINGITVTLEDASTATFDYYPMKVESLGIRNNLDYGLKITFGDLGEALPAELDRIATSNSYLIKPILKYRTYRSDQLETSPNYGRIFGPIVLQVTAFTFNKTGAVFEAKAPSLNLNRTGEAYSFIRFPMLRGFQQ